MKIGRVLVLLIGLGLGALLYWGFVQPVLKARKGPPGQPAPVNGSASPSTSPGGSVKLYVLNSESSLLVPHPVHVAKGTDPAEFALRELAGPTYRKPENWSLVPQGVTPLIVIRRSRRVVVDYPQDFVAKFPPGSDVGYLTVQSIVATLTSIKGVTEVEFQIEGSPVRSLGQVDVTPPVTLDRTVLSQR